LLNRLGALVETHGMQRRLSAIMNADVAGYSAAYGGR
jgi:hypothetical protein